MLSQGDLEAGHGDGQTDDVLILTSQPVELWGHARTEKSTCVGARMPRSLRLRRSLLFRPINAVNGLCIRSFESPPSRSGSSVSPLSSYNYYRALLALNKLPTHFVSAQSARNESGRKRRLLWQPFERLTSPRSWLPIGGFPVKPPPLCERSQGCVSGHVTQKRLGVGFRAGGVVLSGVGFISFLFLFVSCVRSCRCSVQLLLRCCCWHPPL